MTSSLINTYRLTYTGTQLFKKHSSDETGTWQIFGEDPNCDMGGHHHTPLLDTVSGRLGDVVEYAVNLKGFWQWGAGGDIKKVEIRKVEEALATDDARREIEEQIQALQQKLKTL